MRIQLSRFSMCFGIIFLTTGCKKQAPVKPPIPVVQAPVEVSVGKEKTELAAPVPAKKDESIKKVSRTEGKSAVTPSKKVVVAKPVAAVAPVASVVTVEAPKPAPVVVAPIPPVVDPPKAPPVVAAAPAIIPVAPNFDLVKKNLVTLYGSLAVFEADFEQDNAGGKRSGTLYSRKKGDLSRWDYKLPETRFYFSSGSKSHVYYPGDALHASPRVEKLEGDSFYSLGQYLFKIDSLVTHDKKFPVSICPNGVCSYAPFVPNEKATFGDTSKGDIVVIGYPKIENPKKPSDESYMIVMVFKNNYVLKEVSFLFFNKTNGQWMYVESNHFSLTNVRISSRKDIGAADKFLPAELLTLDGFKKAGAK